MLNSGARAMERVTRWWGSPFWVSSSVAARRGRRRRVRLRPVRRNRAERRPSRQSLIPRVPQRRLVWNRLRQQRRNPPRRRRPLPRRPVSPPRNPRQRRRPSPRNRTRPRLPARPPLCRCEQLQVVGRSAWRATTSRREKRRRRSWIRCRSRVRNRCCPCCRTRRPTCVAARSSICWTVSTRRT